MPTSKAKTPKPAGAADTTAAVDEFMEALVHPARTEVEVLRRAILAADPAIAEGIKWNAPSYRTAEYFATTHLRSKVGIGLVLHLGAKVRALPAGGLTIPDPANLLKWLSKDRALVEFRTSKDLEERIPALQVVLREWIKHV